MTISKRNIILKCKWKSYTLQMFKYVSGKVILDRFQGIQKERGC